MKTSLASPAAEDTAALWAARLDGSVLTAEQQSDLAIWLAADPTHRPLLSRYCQFSADLEQQLPLIAGIREMSAGSMAAPETVAPFPWLSRPLLAGVTLTAAAAVVLAFWLARPQPQFTTLATPAAQRQELTLADGTRIELNAQTSLSAEIGPQVRRVRLAAGEAFFAVHKDPARPFVIETPAGAVRVTGTQFAVRTESATTLEVTVTEGAVQVSPAATAAAPFALAVGDRFAGGSVQHLSPAALANALAWRQGQVVFQDTPLPEALARFARYHGRGITADPAVANKHIGGRYSLDDLDGFFADLEEVLKDVQVTRQQNGTVLVSPRPAH